MSRPKSKLTMHDKQIAIHLKDLWDNIINPTITQKAFGKKYSYEQNVVSQIINFRMKPSHSVICAFAQELSCNPIDIDPRFNEPNRFRK
jgi:hypothetical protein